MVWWKFEIPNSDDDILDFSEDWESIIETEDDFQKKRVIDEQTRQLVTEQRNRIKKLFDQHRLIWKFFEILSSWPMVLNIKFYENGQPLFLEVKINITDRKNIMYKDLCTFQMILTQRLSPNLISRIKDYDFFIDLWDSMDRMLMWTIIFSQKTWSIMFITKDFVKKRDWDRLHLISDETVKKVWFQHDPEEIWILELYLIADINSLGYHNKWIIWNISRSGIMLYLPKHKYDWEEDKYVKDLISGWQLNLTIRIMWKLINTIIVKAREEQSIMVWKKYVYKVWCIFEKISIEDKRAIDSFIQITWRKLTQIWFWQRNCTLAMCEHLHCKYCSKNAIKNRKTRVQLINDKLVREIWLDVFQIESSKNALLRYVNISWPVTKWIINCVIRDVWLWWFSAFIQLYDRDWGLNLLPEMFLWDITKLIWWKYFADLDLQTRMEISCESSLMHIEEIDTNWQRIIQLWFEFVWENKDNVRVLISNFIYNLVG